MLQSCCSAGLGTCPAWGSLAYRSLIPTLVVLVPVSIGGGLSR